MKKKIKWMFVISAVISFAVGIYVLMNPAVSLVSMTIMFALTYLINGISEIIQYFSYREESSGWVLFNGVLAVFLSIWMLTGNSFMDMAVFIPYIFTIWVMFAGMARLYISFGVRKIDKKEGNYLLILGILGIVTSIVMNMHPLLTGLFVAYMVGFSFIYRSAVRLVIAYKLGKLS